MKPAINISPKKNNFLTEFFNWINEKNILSMALAYVIGARAGYLADSFIISFIEPFFDTNDDGTNDMHKLKVNFGCLKIRYGVFLSELIKSLVLLYTCFVILRISSSISNVS